MAQNFTLASEQVLSRPNAETPMAVGAATVLFEGEITGSASDLTNNSIRVFVKYHGFVPDTSELPDGTVQNTPYAFGVLAVVEQQQEDASWEEIGRQNNTLGEVQSGKEREIYVTPVSIALEEGVDTEILGFANRVIRKKSAWQDDASGTLRVRIVAMQRLANNEAEEAIANPFVSTTVSISGTRFTA